MDLLASTNKRWKMRKPRANNFATHNNTTAVTLQNTKQQHSASKKRWSDTKNYGKSRARSGTLSNKVTTKWRAKRNCETKRNETKRLLLTYLYYREEWFANTIAAIATTTPTRATDCEWANKPNWKAHTTVERWKANSAEVARGMLVCGVCLFVVVCLLNAARLISFRICCCCCL